MQGDNDGPLDAFGRAFGARVDGASPRGFLRFLSLTAFQAEGCGIALWGDEYEVSVTDLPFCIIRYDRNSADWLAAPSAPLSASGGRINCSMLSCRDMAPLLNTHSAPACGGKVVAPATKGGGTPKWYVKYMTRCFSPQIPRFPLRGSPAKRERMYGAEYR